MESCVARDDATNVADESPATRKRSQSGEAELAGAGVVGEAVSVGGSRAPRAKKSRMTTREDDTEWEGGPPECEP